MKNKKKLGRPKIDNPKVVTIGFRATRGETAEIDAAADRETLDRSAWVRKTLLIAARNEGPS